MEDQPYLTDLIIGLLLSFEFDKKFSIKFYHNSFFFKSKNLQARFPKKLIR